MKPVSQSVPTLMSKVFERKYIALGRIVTHWKEIIGPDFASRAQPAKIRYRKPKNAKEKPAATLDIAASSADCAVLIYQKELILQRINNIFGERWVNDVKFVHVEPRKKAAPAKRTKPLTEDEKNHLSQILETVDDPVIKEALSRMGTSILQEKKP